VHVPARIRTAAGLTAIALTVCLAAAAPWFTASGSSAVVIGLLLGIAGLSLLALFAHAPVSVPDARPPDAVPMPKPAVVDAGLIEQLEGLRRTQAELLAAKRTSEAALLAKDEFLATMSHEIRTPLNGVLPLLELVLSTPLAAEQRDHLGTAYQSAQEMLRIVDDILDYSKLDVGKLELENIGLNLRELVDAVAQLMRRSAEAKGLRLDVSIEPNVRLAVRGDPVRLRQILMNLVSNAIKFTERGGVTILVSRRGETQSAHQIAFAVRDTGIGIAPQAAEKLFLPFSQGDASITRAFGGTGLGLVICKRLVELMGGRIGVQSEPGKGSLFWFAVPLLKVVGDLPAQRDLRGVRALLVGSDEAVLRRLRTELSSQHLQTVEAASTIDALTKLRAAVAMGPRWRYDLVVADALESADKIAAFVRSIAADSNLSHTRIVLLGGRQELTAAATDDARSVILSRAFGAAQLRAAIDALFGAPSPSSAAGADVARVAADSLAQTAPDTPRLLRGRVLLVEDNAVNLHVAQRLLALHGLEIDSAGNGREALERLASASYDIVLMDCQMPLMDGYTATRTWRDIERQRGKPAVPIIAMTANAMAGDREKCLACGMNDYVSKPLSRQRLQQRLLRWLAGSDAGAAESAPVEMQSMPESAATAVPSASAAAKELATASLDPDVVREMREVMGTDFALLVRLYLEETPLKLGELEQATARGDAGAMIGAAHALKSSSANLGANTLAQLVRSVEEDLRTKPDAPLHDRIERVRDEFGRVARELESLLTH
jgi:signal transduction histidine kinase/DNA-binding response OmpR family regulator